MVKLYKQNTPSKALFLLFGLGLASILASQIWISFNLLMLSSKIDDNTIHSAVNYAKNKFEEKTNKSVTGVYFPDCGYFVDTRGRNIEAINRTEYHEACHALIAQDKGGHYCESN